jgi:hypothetical protein
LAINFFRIYMDSSTATTDNALLIVDSKKRYSGTPTDFLYRINVALTRVRSITVVSISIPFTYHVINSTNNVLILNNGAYTATMVVGSYNLTNFQIALSTALNAAGLNSGFSVLYNLSTGFLDISNSLTSFTINSVSSQPTSTLANTLGFTSDATGLTVTGNTSINLAGPRYLYITSEKLCKYFVSQKPRFVDNTFNNAIGIAVVNVAFGGFITSFNPLEVTINDNKGGATYLTTDDIDFTLYDEYGNIVNLNGLDWFMVLKMTQS